MKERFFLQNFQGSLEYFKKFSEVLFQIFRRKKNNTPVSRNAGDEENLLPGGFNLFFLINLIEFLK